MNTIELARLAGLKVGTNISGVTLVGSPSGETIAHLTIAELETFRRLCIEDFVKGVDMEPVAYIDPDTLRLLNRAVVTAHLTKQKHDHIRGEQVALYTAEQVAAQRHKALEEAAEVVEKSPSYDWHKFACEAAAAIRNLKEKK